MHNEFTIAARSLARSPAHTLVVVLTLGLGIGTAATFYSMLKQALFPRAPYAEPERLVRVELQNRSEPSARAPFLLKFHSYRGAKSVTELAGAWSEMGNVLANGEPQGVFVTRVTKNFFLVLGVVPGLGRGFAAEEYEPGKSDVVLLTDWFWRERLGADPRVLERELTVNGRSMRVVGVLPRDFTAPSTIATRSVFVPYPLPPTVDGEPFRPIVTIGRLASGASAAELKAELDTLRPEKGKSYEKFMAGFEVQVAPVTAPPDNVWARRYYRMLWTSMGAVACLYAIAVVNAGSLILVRMLGRRREIGIRLALGGGRWQVMRPFLWEALLLAAGTVLAGWAIGQWLMPALLSFAPTGQEGEKFRLNQEGLAFLATLGGLTGVAVVLAPAWHATRLNINDVVKDGSVAAGESRGSRRLRDALVVVEAALAVVLLTGAGLMVRTFARLAEQHPGYEVGQRYVVQFTEEMADRPKGEALLARRRLMLERVAAVPGVLSVGIAMASTPSFYFPQQLRIAGRNDAVGIEAMGNPVSPELLDTLGVPLKFGRPMAAQRPTDPPAVWINETMARRHFPDRNPLGEKIEGVGRTAWEVAGVVGDQLSLRDGAKPRFYFPYWQAPQWAMSQLVLRMVDAPGPKFESEIRRALYEIDPKIVVLDIRSVARHRDAEVGSERFVHSVLRVLSALALLLAATGLFAMMAYSVAQRRGEFGVRLALGATAPALYRLVLGAGVGLAALGVLIGLGASWGLARFIEALLIGMSPHDPVTFAAVGLLMVAIALPACWWPARQAARVDVTKLLRSE